MPQNIGFDGIYFCPHKPEENCACRKPGTKMLESALSDFKLNINEFDSYIIGDRDSDMEAGLKAGIKTRIFIGDGLSKNATHFARNLKEVVEIFKA